MTKRYRKGQKLKVVGMDAVVTKSDGKHLHLELGTDKIEVKIEKKHL